MDDTNNSEISEKSLVIKKCNESLISYQSIKDKKDSLQESKENKNLNERIIKLFIGNHPLLSMKIIKNISRMHFLNKYAKTETYYNSLIIEHIIHNEPGHVVAEFKDFLILGDVNEFLLNYYKKKESIYFLPKIVEYYINCSVIFPNYVILPESQYIYKNIQKKQKVIDIQQEQEDREENIKKGLIKEENKETVFTTQILDSILNQTDTSGIKQFFGMSTEGNSLCDQLSKIIDGIHYYENNKVSDLRPRYNNYLYKNHQKIYLNDSSFKRNGDNDTIKKNDKINETNKYININSDKIKDKQKIKITKLSKIDLVNKTNKKSVLLLNKKNINNIIDLSNSIKNINESSLNSTNKRSMEKNGVSPKNMVSKNSKILKNKYQTQNQKKKGRNCLGNLIKENTNYYNTTNNDIIAYSNIENITSNTKCNTSRQNDKQKKVIKNPKIVYNNQKIKHKNRKVFSSDLNIFYSKPIKKSLINSLLNQEREISNKEIINSNEIITLSNIKENTKSSMNNNYYIDSMNKIRNKKKKKMIRNINQNLNDESEYLYFKNRSNILSAVDTKNDKNLVYQKKRNSDVIPFYNKNKISQQKNIKIIGLKTKNYSTSNILEHKNNISASNILSKIKQKNNENNKNSKTKKKLNTLNNQNKISKHINIKSSEFLSNNIFNKNKQIIRTENEIDKIFIKKEKNCRNNSGLNKIYSYNFKPNKFSTFKLNNSNNNLNTARFIYLEKGFQNKSTEKNHKNNGILKSPGNIQLKKLELKSDLGDKIINDDIKRPLTMRETLKKKDVNYKNIELLTNKINQIKEYIKEIDQKNKNSLSHIFRKKKVGRKKILKNNDEDFTMKYGLTERLRNKNNINLNLNSDNLDKKNKNIKIEENKKSNKNIIKIEKKQIKNIDKTKKINNNNKNTKINKTNKNDKIKNIRNMKINNGNNFISDSNYNINLNKYHIHNKNKSEFYQRIDNNKNVNSIDNISINNNTELGKGNKNIILINNNVKIGSIKVFPIKQVNQNKIIVKGIKINGFEKFVSKKYATRNIDIPKAATDRFQNVNGNTSQNSSNRYINTSNNNMKKLAKNKKNGNYYFKKV